MKTSRKMAAFLLVFAMILSLVACVATPEQPVDPPATTQKSPATDPGTDEPQTENAPHADPGLPSKNYDGQTYRVLASEAYGTYGRARDVEYDDTLTEINNINEAVRSRNDYISDKYGAEIRGVFQSDRSKRLSEALSTGLSICEVVEDAMRNYVPLLELGQLNDLNTFSPYLDLTQAWWNQNCRSSLSIANKLYFEAGDIMTTDKEATWAISFNRDLIKNNNLDNPYDLVENNVWTYDAMYGLAQQISDAADHPGDQFAATWGVVSENGNTYMLWQGCGASLIIKDAVTDLPQLAPLTEGDYDAMLKVATIQFDKNVTLLASDVKGVADIYSEGIRRIFQIGHSLFFVGAMSMVEWMRDNDTDFGVLPMPKLNIAQENYYSSSSSTYAFALAIPNDPRMDKEFVAIITQALGCESTDTLIQAYYDKTLVYKGLRRVEDVKMLNLVFNSRIFDLSGAFDWASPLMNQIGAAKNEAKVKSIKSKYDSYAKNINGSINNFLEKQGLI